MTTTFFSFLVAGLIIDLVVRFFMGHLSVSDERNMFCGQVFWVIFCETSFELIASFLTIIFFVLFHFIGISGTSFSLVNPFFLIPAFFTIFATVFFGLRAFSRLENSSRFLWIIFWILSSPAVTFFACGFWLTRVIKPDL